MYEVIAKVYDLFMDDDEWVKFAVEAVKGKRRGADVGCGSGSVSLALSREHEVVAIDPSVEMLNVARNKFLKHGVNIPTVLQRAEELNLYFKADFITAMCDVVNYIKSPIKFFTAARNNLADDGILVFDISSEYKLKNVLGSNVYSQTKNDITYVWENFLIRDRVDMTLTFFFPTGDGLYRKKVDMQTQYIHTTDDICDALTLSGYDYQMTDKGDRIYFVARKGKV